MGLIIGYKYREVLPALIPMQTVKSSLERRSNRVWENELPSIRPEYEALGASDVLTNSGIPPLLGSNSGLNTKRAAISIALELLKGLAPATCIREAMIQVQSVLEYVRDEGTEKRLKYLSQIVELDDVDTTQPMTIDRAMVSCSDSPYYSFSGPSINPLSSFQKNDKRLYMGTSYTRHALIIGRNGAIQILKMPNAIQLIEMIEHDDRAARYILRHKPLYDTNGPIIFFSRDDLINHLRDEELLKARTERSMDNDVNRLFRSAPFDLPRHIKSGRLKVVFDKVGSDGLSVWQNTRDDFYQILRKEIE